MSQLCPKKSFLHHKPWLRPGWALVYEVSFLEQRPSPWSRRHSFHPLFLLSPCCLLWHQHPNPAFTAKTITSYRSRVFTLGGFFSLPHNAVEEISSHLLCPVLSLPFSIACLAVFNCCIQLLFVNFRARSEGLPLSVQHWSHWLCEVCISSGSQPDPELTPPWGLYLPSLVWLLNGPRQRTWGGGSKVSTSRLRIEAVREVKPPAWESKPWCCGSIMW